MYKQVHDLYSLVLSIHPHATRGPSRIWVRVCGSLTRALRVPTMNRNNYLERGVLPGSRSATVQRRWAQWNRGRSAHCWRGPRAMTINDRRSLACFEPPKGRWVYYVASLLGDPTASHGAQAKMTWEKPGASSGILTTRMDWDLASLFCYFAQLTLPHGSHDT